MRGYKVFDKNLQCRGFQFVVGETYVHDGEVELCKSGFHFCLNAKDCFDYYAFDSRNRVCEVEADLVSNEIENDSKRVCGKITLIRELSWHEVLDLVNTGKNNTGINNTGDLNSGNRNSGNCNSGNLNSGNLNSGNHNTGDFNSGNRNSGNRNSGRYNSGDYNSGNYNSGHCNSGYSNSGDLNSGDFNSRDYNSGDYNSGNCNSGNLNSGNCNSGNLNSGNFNSGYRNNGLFNRNEPTINIFEVDCGMTMTQLIHNSMIPYVHLVYQEIINDKLVKYTYKEAWKNWWSKNDEYINQQKKKILNLPNFNAQIFEEITGIKVENKSC